MLLVGRPCPCPTCSPQAVIIAASTESHHQAPFFHHHPVCRWLIIFVVIRLVAFNLDSSIQFYYSRIMWLSLSWSLYLHRSFFIVISCCLTLPVFFFFIPSIVFHTNQFVMSKLYHWWFLWLKGKENFGNGHVKWPNQTFIFIGSVRFSSVRFVCFSLTISVDIRVNTVISFIGQTVASGQINIFHNTMLDVVWCNRSGEGNKLKRNWRNKR